jgi:hypothetical protein
MAAVFVSSVLAIFRIGGENSAFYQAIAHLWVGILIGVWIVGRDKWYGGTAILLSFLELACFLIQGHSK